MSDTTGLPLKLITRAEAREILGLRGKTGHTLRRLELRGLLASVRLGHRTVRYKIADVVALIECSTSDNGTAAK